VRETFTTGLGAQRANSASTWSRHCPPSTGPRPWPSLQRAWPGIERVYGLEYDLDEFNNRWPCAISTWAANGEPRASTSSNSKAGSWAMRFPQKRTANFERIESVICPRYFHNWTGNRIQTAATVSSSPLKEGLTVISGFNPSLLISIPLFACQADRGMSRCCAKTPSFSVEGCRVSNGPSGLQGLTNTRAIDQLLYTTTIYGKRARSFLNPRIAPHPAGGTPACFMAGMALYVAGRS